MQAFACGKRAIQFYPASSIQNPPGVIFGPTAKIFEKTILIDKIPLSINFYATSRFILVFV
jgi:hypothetical protein